MESLSVFLLSMIPSWLTTVYGTKIYQLWKCTTSHQLSAIRIIWSKTSSRTIKIWPVQRWSQPAATPCSNTAVVRCQWKMKMSSNWIALSIVATKKSSWWEWTLPTVYNQFWQQSQINVQRDTKDHFHNFWRTIRTLLTWLQSRMTKRCLRMECLAHLIWFLQKERETTRAVNSFKLQDKSWTGNQNQS